jgi:hypothetical protein
LVHTSHDCSKSSLALSDHVERLSNVLVNARKHDVLFLLKHVFKVKVLRKIRIQIILLIFSLSELNPLSRPIILDLNDHSWVTFRQHVQVLKVPARQKHLHFFK